MEQAVTAKVKLSNRDELQQTIEKYSEALQLCTDTAWEKNIQYRSNLHDEVYYQIREEYDMPAQLTCNIISDAVQTVNGSHSKPEITEEPSPRYNFPRSASVNEEWTELSILTTEGRIKLDIEVPECYKKYLDCEVTDSRLVKKNGEFYFYFGFAKEVNIQSSCRDSQVLGVDLGVNKTAVASDNSFYGTEIKKKRRKRDRKVAEIQSKGTHEAHNRIKEMGSRWKRFIDWKNHNISRKIVDSVERGDVIVLENLTHIRESSNSNTDWVHKWSFKDLQDKIEYKAHLKGVKVEYIKPRNTSKKCSECNHISEENRKKGFFECEECGFSLDADLNASRNIAQRYMRNNGQAGSSVNLPNGKKSLKDSGNDDSDVVGTSEEENTRKPQLKQERQG
jgi:IS605 OrfB family transposase